MDALWETTQMSRVRTNTSSKSSSSSRQAVAQQQARPSAAYAPTSISLCTSNKAAAAVPGTAAVAYTRAGLYRRDILCGLNFRVDDRNQMQSTHTALTSQQAPRYTAQLSYYLPSVSPRAPSSPCLLLVLSAIPAGRVRSAEEERREKREEQDNEDPFSFRRMTKSHRRKPPVGVR